MFVIQGKCLQSLLHMIKVCLSPTMTQRQSTGIQTTGLCLLPVLCLPSTQCALTLTVSCSQTLSVWGTPLPFIIFKQKEKQFVKLSFEINDLLRIKQDSKNNMEKWTWIKMDWLIHVDFRWSIVLYIDYGELKKYVCFGPMYTFGMRCTHVGAQENVKTNI